MERTAENIDKIQQLLASDDLKNVELGFVLYVAMPKPTLEPGTPTWFGNPLFDQLKAYPMFCLKYDLTEHVLAYSLVLRFDRQEITSLSEGKIKDIFMLKRLRILELGNNQIAELPKEVGQLCSLETLNLDYNQLTTLPGELSQLEKLFFVSLMHNPIPLSERDRLREMLPQATLMF